MADNACAQAASSVVGHVVTASYAINVLAPARGERFRSRGVVVKAGKRQAIVRGGMGGNGKWNADPGSDCAGDRRLDGSEPGLP